MLSLMDSGTGTPIPNWRGLRAADDKKPERLSQGGRRSGIPDYLTFRRLCPNAPGFSNLVPGTWTRA
jgi:hypothetical protein